MPLRSDPNHFLRRCNKTDSCWEWLGATNNKGYGIVGYHRKLWSAHKLSYNLFVDPSYTGLVLHKCDNRKCIRPDHLFPGTAKINTQDMISKDRHARGERNGHAKLSAEDIITIRKLESEGKLHKELAIQYGVNRPTITKIVNKQRWSHI